MQDTTTAETARARIRSVEMANSFNPSEHEARSPRQNSSRCTYTTFTLAENADVLLGVKPPVKRVAVAVIWSFTITSP